MQPYFFPYLGQFQLISSVERFVLMDRVQYIRHGWINRNRIQDRNADFRYIVVPVRKHSYKAMISDVEAVDGEQWKEEILKHLDVYRRKAPYFTRVCSLVEECLSTSEQSITRLNALCLRKVCQYIGIHQPVEIWSDLGIPAERYNTAQERVLGLMRQLGGSEYYNPPGGAALYDKEIFKQNGFGLSFVVSRLSPYDQGREDFVAGLSIIDVMMFNSPTEIMNLLKDCEII